MLSQAYHIIAVQRINLTFIDNYHWLGVLLQAIEHIYSNMRMCRVLLWLGLLASRCDTATVSSGVSLSNACFAPYDCVLQEFVNVPHMLSCAVYCTDNYRCSSFMYDAMSLVCHISSSAVPSDVRQDCENLVTYGAASQVCNSGWISLPVVYVCAIVNLVLFQCEAIL